jgi:hypothetical protein
MSKLENIMASLLKLTMMAYPYPQLPAQAAKSRIRKEYKANDVSPSTSTPVVSSSKGDDRQEQEKAGGGESGPVIEYLKNQNYSDMTPSEINELLGIMTLGEGKEFQQSKTNHVTSLTEFSIVNPSGLKFMEKLEGTYRSDFVDSIPKADEQGYVIELSFLEKRIDIAISLNSKVYYEHTFTDLKKTLMIGKSSDLPPNLFIELPAKPQYGYAHPLYLEMLIGADNKTFIGVLYNTNQTVPSNVNYLHAENLIFKKVY